MINALKTYFGYTSFREGQKTIIEKILNGNDTLGIMPTGAGKSICFQLPSLMMNGITLVISPLISLMKDQVTALNQVGIRAAYINSTLSPTQYNKVLQLAANYEYKIIYVAPERLLSKDFLDFVNKIKISMVTIDEAHCVSQWGQDFRPSYMKIPRFIDSLPERPIISAFTATATVKVKEDILVKLNMNAPYTLVTGFDRENLHFAVSKPKDKMAALKAFLKDRKKNSGIVYCSTRKNVEDVCEKLKKAGYSVTRYHAGLPDAERKINQEAFTLDEVSIMVATNAFGMGIDKSNVSFVVHYNMPKNIESYYQEAGRAGRDGSSADCLLLYSPQDVVMNQFLIDRAGGNEDLSAKEKKAIKEKDRELLKWMTFYCHSKDCLRAYILKYFGESPERFCGNCSVCAPMDYSWMTSVANEGDGAEEFAKTARKTKVKKSKYKGDAASVKTIKIRKPVKKKKGSSPSIDGALFEKLRSVRLEIAKEQKVPAFIIFSDATLEDMCKKQPKTKEAFLDVSGVGQTKLLRYGDRFIKAIKG